MKIFTLSLVCVHVSGFVQTSSLRVAKPLLPMISRAEDEGRPGDTTFLGEDGSSVGGRTTRRRILRTVQSFVILGGPLLNGGAARALVKGVAPPPPKSKTDKPKCTNVEECQAQAEKRQQEEATAEAENVEPPKTTIGGTRYRDLVVGR